MSARICCAGCGVPLQDVDPGIEGYVPPEKLAEGGPLFCRRCFKITHYGEYHPFEVTPEQYREEVDAALKKAGVVLAIFDIADFEGSFAPEILDILRERDAIVVINKIDLLAREKHPSKLSAWVGKRLAEEGVVPLDTAFTSTKTGYGVSGIYKRLKTRFPDGVTAAVLGVTNTGKSSIINRLTGQKRITVSKYPGTTRKAIKTSITDIKATILDTPGLIARGGFTDLLCAQCVQRLIPSSGLKGTEFKGAEDRMILIERLLWLRPFRVGETKPAFTVWCADTLHVHETGVKKGPELFRGDLPGCRELLPLPCEHCGADYRKRKFTKLRKTVNPGEDLVIKGLGWIAVRRGPVTLEVCLPADVDVVIRQSLL